MSPWRRERVCAWIAPTGVVLARVRSGFRVVHLTSPAHVLSVERGPGAPAHRACIAALDTLLERAQWRAAHLNIVVSDHFVRFVLLEWRPGLSTEHDWQAYAGHALETRYGANARSRDIRVVGIGARSPRLGVAIDTEMLESLRSSARKAALRLSLVEPNMCRIANRCRSALTKRAGYLLMLEPGRVGLLGAAENVWIDCRSVLAGENPVVAACQLLQQSRFALNRSIEHVGIWAGDTSVVAAVKQLGFGVELLAPPNGTPRECFALGLA